MSIIHMVFGFCPEYSKKSTDNIYVSNTHVLCFCFCFVFVFLFFVVFFLVFFCFIGYSNSHSQYNLSKKSTDNIYVSNTHVLCFLLLFFVS